MSSARLRFAALAATLLLGALACRDDPERAAAALEARFEAALEEHDLADAAASVDALRDVLPESVDSSLRLAKLLSRAGKISEALWLLEEAETRYPGKTRIELGIAETALLVADGARALQSLAQVDADDPLAAYAVLLRSRALLALGDLEGSLAALEAGAQRYPEKIEIALAWIQALVGQHEYERALGVVSQVEARAALAPDQRSWLELTRAAVLARQSKPDAALAVLAALLEREPANARAWRDRVQLLLSQGRAERAVALLEVASAKYPDMLDLHLLMISAQSARGDLDAARRAQQEVVRRVKGAANRIAVANRLHAVGLLDEAMSVLDAPEPGLARDEEAELAYLRAAFLLDAGRHEAARARFEAFRRAFPADPQVALLQARFELDSGDAGDARTAAARLRRVVSKLDRPDVQHWLGIALEAAGDFAGAEYRFGLALQRDTKQVASYLGLIRMLERRAAWSEMTKSALQLVALEPGNAAGYDALVRALLAAERPGEAEEVLRTYAKRFPEALAPIVGLSRSLRARSRAADALAELESGRARFGQEPAFLAEQAFVLQRLGRGGEALRSLEEARARGVRNAQLERARAYLLFMAGDGAGGEAAAEEALSLAPADPTPLRMLGDYRMLQRDHAGAARAYERFLAKRSSDPQVLAHLGDALARQDRRGPAIDAYRRAVALDASALSARNNLALLLAQEGRIDEALEAAQAAYARAENEPIVMDTLGHLFVRKGLVKRGVALLRKAQKLAPEMPELREHLALAERAASGSESTGALRDDRPRGPERAERSPGPRVLASSGDLTERLAALDRPNLVLFVVDTLRADATAPYGFDARVSPELARLAEHGVVFERVLAQSSWTKVSMASLLTSLWPQSHGVRLPADGLSEAAVTIQDVLKDAGYATYGVQSNGWLEQSFGFHYGFDRYLFPHATSMARELGRSSVWPHGERVLGEAARLLDAHDRKQPFFLYLHLMDVHEYAAPPEFKLFGNDQRASYSAAIRWIDDVLKRLRAKLEDERLASNTILVFAADHAEAFGENGVYGHARNVFTPVLQVPLMIHFPFDMRGRRVRSQVRNLDIAPTLAELAGAAAPELFQGQSLLPLIRSSESEPDRPSYADLGSAIMAHVVGQVSVNDGAWSLARNLDEEGKEFLFDRRVDPREDANLLEFEPEQAGRMRALLDAHLELGPIERVRNHDVWIEPSIANRLKALGYLQ